MVHLWGHVGATETQLYKISMKYEILKEGIEAS